MILPRSFVACWLVLTVAPLVCQGQNPSPPPYKPAANASEAIKRIEALGGNVRKVALEGDALEVDLRSTSVTDHHLQYLLVLRNVAVIRLRECAVGDAGLVHVGKIPGLKKLHLEKTAISDAGIKHLAGLKELEILNLYCCNISDGGLAHLQSLPKLKSLFVAETKASEAGITALRKAMPKLVVVPDRALDREQAEIAWQTAKKARADMEIRFQQAKKESEVMSPRIAELKKTLDDATKRLNDAKSKGEDAIVKETQAALKVAQQQHSQATNAVNDFKLAQKHLDAYRQLEAEAHARVKALRAK